MNKVKVGVVGCGRIFPAYAKNLKEYFAGVAEMVACADLVPEAASKRASEFGIPLACPVRELLANPEVEVVVNLTIPEAHYDLSLAAIAAGKHVFSEKPLAVTFAEGRKLIAAANAKGLWFAGAADTFLGAGLQTCRRLLDDGTVGGAVAAHASISLGSKSPRYHRRGVGPMFDMGPYFVTALVALLGPVTRVSGSAQGAGKPKMSAAKSPEAGQAFAAETASTVCGVLDFACGAVGMVTATSDSVGYLPELNIYGTNQVLVCPDPNHHAGPVALRMWQGQDKPVEVAGFAEKGRALGVAEMALAIRERRMPRASGQLMLHVLEIMEGIHTASETGRHVNLETRCERPAAFDVGSVLRPQ